MQAAGMTDSIDLPGWNSNASKTIIKEIQFQSFRLAKLKDPLSPMPIHSVRLKFFDCCSSALKLRETRLNISSLLLALSFTEDYYVLLYMGGAWRKPAFKLVSGQWSTGIMSIFNFSIREKKLLLLLLFSNPKQNRVWQFCNKVIASLGSGRPIMDHNCH